MAMDVLTMGVGVFSFAAFLIGSFHHVSLGTPGTFIEIIAGMCHCHYGPATGINGHWIYLEVGRCLIAGMDRCGAIGHDDSGIIVFFLRALYFRSL